MNDALHQWPDESTDAHIINHRLGKFKVLAPTSAGPARHPLPQLLEPVERHADLGVGRSPLIGILAAKQDDKLPAVRRYVVGPRSARNERHRFGDASGIGVGKAPGSVRTSTDVSPARLLPCASR